MDWFRHYHGLCTDPKLHKASRLARVRRSVVIAGWCAVLESASQASERGSLAGYDASDLGFMIDESESVAGRLLEAFRALEMIADDGVSAWSRRQKISDDVTPRVQKHRVKNRAHENVIDCSVSTVKPNLLKKQHSDHLETLLKPTIEQNRAEQIRKKERATPKRSSSLDDLSLDDDLREVARTEGRNADRELAAFKDGCRAKGRTYRDYRAAFRNWLRSPYGRTSEPPRDPPPGQPSRWQETRARQAAEDQCRAEGINPHVDVGMARVGQIMREQANGHRRSV